MRAPPGLPATEPSAPRHAPPRESDHDPHDREPHLLFVIADSTFNTKAAAIAAVHRGIARDADRDERFEDVLYRAGDGTFFLHRHRAIKAGKGKPVVEDRAEILTPAAALAWIREVGAAVTDATGLELPPER